MLEVRPHGALKRGFDLVDRAGATVGAFSGSAWRERGRVLAGPREWEFRREGGRRFALVGPRGTEATADKPSLWSSTWRLTVGPRRYELVKPSWLSSRYELRAGGTTVGGLHRRGVFSSKTDVSLPPELPPPAQVFVVAIVLTLWRREQSSAAAGGGAAAAAAS